MYDWKRREDTKNLLRHDNVRNDKINDINGKSNNSLTPSKQRQQYPQHHLNLSQNIYNGETNVRQSNLSTDKQIRQRSIRTYDHSPIFGNERAKTEMNEVTSTQNKMNVRNTNTFSSTVFKQSVEEIPNKIKYNNQTKNAGDKSRDISNSNKFTLSYKENNDMQTDNVFQNKKHFSSKDNNIFKTLTPRSVRENQYKVRDHTSEQIFGDEPQVCIKKPHPQPYQPNYRQESPAQKKQMEFYASRNSNGDIIPLTSRNERCQTTFETDKQVQRNGILNTQMNESTSGSQIRNLTPQQKKQIHMLGSFSEHKQPYLINKNNQQVEKYKDEIRCYNDKWWNKVEKQKNNNVECFLSNKDIAEQQKYKQLKSDFFDEINNQIFGSPNKDINNTNSITAEEIEAHSSVSLQQKQRQQNTELQEKNQNKQRSTLTPEQQTKQRKWQIDTNNEDKRRKDQNYSDLFGYGETKAPQKNFKDDCLFPANFNINSYDSLKFQQDYPSANIQYGNNNQCQQQEKINEQEDNMNQQVNEQKYGLKQNMKQATSDQKYYANLSSSLDQNGYKNHYSKDNAWKQNKNLKFDKFNLVEQNFDDHQSASINFGCPKNDEGQNQRVIEIDFKNFSDKFDQNEFKKYCSRKGIHLVDFQYDFDKLNNKIAGTGQIKIRDIHQDTSRVENVKDHLRQQGLILKSSRVTLSTQSVNYQNDPHHHHENYNSQYVESAPSNFNPNISEQASQQLQAKNNKKNVESKGFKLLVTQKKKVNGQIAQGSKTQTQYSNNHYDTSRSELSSSKKLPQNNNYKKGNEGLSKERKQYQETRSKSPLINRKYSNPVV